MNLHSRPLRKRGGPRIGTGLEWLLISVHVIQAAQFDPYPPLADPESRRSDTAKAVIRTTAFATEPHLGFRNSRLRSSAAQRGPIKSISRSKLTACDTYLAQRYAPHAVVARDGTAWKYDVRFFAGRGQVMSATN